MHILSPKKFSTDMLCIFWRDSVSNIEVRIVKDFFFQSDSHRFLTFNAKFSSNNNEKKSEFHSLFIKKVPCGKRTLEIQNRRKIKK